ncbi:hypothetical protein THAR02_08375 [Trichoderma harzianum]|uniref:Uncharacterized protein n=1 Tax=Trichoderma harzianum TaxID=5544 RepID=A0A0F9ZGW1_TRIHA|nr:hypothetical protein THAR02_08375 [Trichoderma harzianum]
MASPYSVPHSRSTLGVKVLQPMLMLFSPEAGVGSRSLDATSQQSSLSSQARTRKGQLWNECLVLDSSTIKKLELSSQAGSPEK